VVVEVAVVDEDVESVAADSETTVVEASVMEDVVSVEVSVLKCVTETVEESKVAVPVVNSVEMIVGTVVVELSEVDSVVMRVGRTIPVGSIVVGSVVERDEETSGEASVLDSVPDIVAETVSDASVLGSVEVMVELVLSIEVEAAVANVFPGETVSVVNDNVDRAAAEVASGASTETDGEAPEEDKRPQPLRLVVDGSKTDFVSEEMAMASTPAVTTATAAKRSEDLIDTVDFQIDRIGRTLLLLFPVTFHWTLG
jgi:hypothetical protein